MQGVSTFAILVVFVCAQPWAASAQILQPCELVKNGTQSGGKIVEEQGTIPQDEGPVVRIYIEADNLNVIGSSLLFCDDLVDEAVIELAQDKKSYLVHRQQPTLSESFYWMKLYVSNKLHPVSNYQAPRQRPLQLKRPYH